MNYLQTLRRKIRNAKWTKPHFQKLDWLTKIITAKCKVNSKLHLSSLLWILNWRSSQWWQKLHWTDPCKSNNFLQNFRSQRQEPPQTPSPPLEFQQSKSNSSSTDRRSTRFQLPPLQNPRLRESRVNGVTDLVGAGAVGDGSAAAAPPVGDAAEARLRGQPLRRALHRQKPEANLAQSKQALATAQQGPSGP